MPQLSPMMGFLMAAVTLSSLLCFLAGLSSTAPAIKPTKTAKKATAMFTLF
uniref:ATP synthase F0 subunit 8 n=1 Tax=Hermissenda emurai TaxID=1840523 RepID=A0A6H0N3K9_9GAST|nr:ATP synthase F0 subunit 8 [Hermissenda emurai]QIV24373.1 ATP synthase F0 subunit 8 [Hermissenda emurai]